MLSKFHGRDRTAVMLVTAPLWLPVVLPAAILGAIARLATVGFMTGWEEPFGFLPDSWIKDEDPPDRLDAMVVIWTPGRVLATVGIVALLLGLCWGVFAVSIAVTGGSQ